MRTVSESNKEVRSRRASLIEMRASEDSAFSPTKMAPTNEAIRQLRANVERATQNTPNPLPLSPRKASSKTLDSGHPSAPKRIWTVRKILVDSYEDCRPKSSRTRVRRTSLIESLLGDQMKKRGQGDIEQPGSPRNERVKSLTDCRLINGRVTCEISGRIMTSNGASTLET
jgi:hypothetical protein